jgi:hypothetical protein
MLALALIALSMVQAVDLPSLEQDYLAMFGGSYQRATVSGRDVVRGLVDQVRR